MSDSHKAALREGRVEGRAVREYLEALRSTKSRQGRRHSAASITRRLGDVDDLLTDADALTELKLIQERRNLVAERAAMDASVDTAGLEDAFVAVAQSYGERQGISYATWREIGVPPAS
jgi:hypothetical protein